MNALNAAQRMQMIEKFETLTISEYEALVSVNEQLRRRVQELEELLKESYKDADEVLRPRVAELEKERDELLAALEAGRRLIELISPFEGDVTRQIDKAIASVKEKQNVSD